MNTSGTTSLALQAGNRMRRHSSARSSAVDGYEVMPLLPRKDRRNLGRLALPRARNWTGRQELRTTTTLTWSVCLAGLSRCLWRFVRGPVPCHKAGPGIASDRVLLAAAIAAI